MQLPIPPPPDSDNHNPLSFSVSFFNSVYLFLAALSFHCCTGFLQLQQVGAILGCYAWVSHGGGFSCRQALAVAHGFQKLQHAGLVVPAHEL